MVFGDSEGLTLLYLSHPMSGTPEQFRSPLPHCVLPGTSILSSATIRIANLHIQTATPGDCQHASVVAEHQQLSLNRTLLRPVEPAQGGVLHLEANVVFLEATGAALLPWAETQSTRAGRLGDQACLAQNMSFSAGLTVTTLAFNAGLHGCNRC